MVMDFTFTFCYVTFYVLSCRLGDNNNFHLKFIYFTYFYFLFAVHLLFQKIKIKLKFLLTIKFSVFLKNEIKYINF